MNVLRTIGSFFSAETLDCEVKRGILIVAIVFEWLAITVLLFSVLGPWDVFAFLKVSLFYGIGCLLLFAIAGVNIYIGKNDVEIYKKIALAGVCIVGIMMLFCTIQPSTNIRNIAKAIATYVETKATATTAPIPEAPKKEAVIDSVHLSSGIYIFPLNPGEINDKWITVEEGHNYSFSSSTAHSPVDEDFSVIYKDGTIKKVDKADIVLPAGPGPFKLQGGKNGAYIKLLVM